MYSKKVKHYIEIAEKLKISERSLKREMKELKEKGYIERIGAKKNGYWKVNIDKL